MQSMAVTAKATFRLLRRLPRTWDALSGSYSEPPCEREELLEHQPGENSAATRSQEKTQILVKNLDQRGSTYTGVYGGT